VAQKQIPLPKIPEEVLKCLSPADRGLLIASEHRSDLLGQVTVEKGLGVRWRWRKRS